MANDTRFKKGQPSANPGGRPRGVDRLAREIAALRTYKAKDGKEYTGAAAIMQVLLDVAFDTDAKDRDRVDAASKALDRVWGKPQQHIDFGGKKRAAPANLPALSDDELRTLAKLDAELGDEDDELDDSERDDGAGAVEH